MLSRRDVSLFTNKDKQNVQEQIFTFIVLFPEEGVWYDVLIKKQLCSVVQNEEHHLHLDWPQTLISLDQWKSSEWSLSVVKQPHLVVKVSITAAKEESVVITVQYCHLEATACPNHK